MRGHRSADAVQVCTPASTPRRCSLRRRKALHAPGAVTADGEPQPRTAEAIVSCSSLSHAPLVSGTTIHRRSFRANACDDTNRRPLPRTYCTSPGLSSPPLQSAAFVLVGPCVTQGSCCRRGLSARILHPGQGVTAACRLRFASRRRHADACSDAVDHEACIRCDHTAIGTQRGNQAGFAAGRPVGYSPAYSLGRGVCPHFGGHPGMVLLAPRPVSAIALFAAPVGAIATEFLPPVRKRLLSWHGSARPTL